MEKPAKLCCINRRREETWNWWLANIFSRLLIIIIIIGGACQAWTYTNQFVVPQELYPSCWVRTVLITQFDCIIWLVIWCLQLMSWFMIYYILLPGRIYSCPEGKGTRGLQGPIRRWPTMWMFVLDHIDGEITRGGNDSHCFLFVGFLWLFQKFENSCTGLQNCKPEIEESFSLVSMLENWWKEEWQGSLAVSDLRKSL